MADEVERPGGGPDQHEEAAPHHPTPAIWPAGFAAGLILAVVGLLVSWPVVAVGAGLAVVFLSLWVRDLTREVRHAPEPEPEAPPPHELVGEVEEPEEAAFTRSRFLEASTLGLGAVIGGIVTVPVVGFAVAPAFVGQGAEDVDLGPLSNFPEGKWLVATFISKKSEGDVSKRTAFLRNNGLANSVPSFTIISNRCAHMGCPTQPLGPSQEPRTIQAGGEPVVLRATQPSGFGCPCHGGAYDDEGNRTAGPPVRGLDRYQYKIVNGNLVLGTPYSVGKVTGKGAAAKIEAYGRADPGQHINDWEGYFYPYIP